MSEIADFTRIYWKLLDLTDFTDFNEITEIPQKYQVFQGNAIPFSVSIRKLVKSKRYLARLQKRCF